MPELPEVERAAKLLRAIARNNQIIRVDTTEDAIVYSGITHHQFKQALEGRIVIDVARYGKVFYMQLDGEGKMPVMHFGMTGMLQVKGKLATYYKETPRTASTDWPPRFMKFILHFKDRTSEKVTQVAFLDARRLGRVRLCASPLDEPPISALGFDPILSMPALDQFKALVLKRSCPIKALLLDQSFSAGVGNWVADEILYHSRVHPERRCNTLTDDELTRLHHHTRQVCDMAVEANADDTKFPENWLFKHRWGKGKKKHTLLLPSGDPATIKWIKVGGRTSAFVAELQRLTSDGVTTANISSGNRENKRAANKHARLRRIKRQEEEDDESDGESDLTSLASDNHSVKEDAKLESKSGIGPEPASESSMSRKRKGNNQNATRLTRQRTSALQEA